MTERKDQLFDKDCLDVVDDNLNMAVPWYLMASYAYYEEDRPILSDNVFDRLARKILEFWEVIDHLHKDYLNEDMLRAGTFIGEYPSRVKFALQELRSTND